MNRVIIFLVSLVLLWFGLNHFKPKKEAWQVDVSDPVVRFYLIEWERDMKNHGLDPAPALGRLRSITVVNTTEWAGQYVTSERVIYISRYQVQQGPASTRATVYHELGHMAFKLEHGDCGIMDINSETEEYYSANWGGLLNEYINKCYERRWESF
jgi:hypothetical protein